MIGGRVSRNSVRVASIGPDKLEHPNGDRRSKGARAAHCPRCHREIVWYGNPHRPFCSFACRLLDLGVWLDEGYRIEAERLSSTDELDVS
jgi:uncharacterized protein